MIIKEFEDKLKEFLNNSKVNSECQITETLETEMQTDPITETSFKNELNGYASKNRELEDELYEVK